MKIAVPSEMREFLDDLSTAVEVSWYATKEEALEAVRGAEAIWYHLDPAAAVEILDVEPGLRWLSTIGAGMDRWPLDELRSRPITVTNGAGLAAIPIAEYTVGTMLAAGRDLRAIFAAQARSHWDPSVAGSRELHGRRALIVGYGSIGRAIGERLRGFGVEVVGARRLPDGTPGVIGADQWRARIGEFDWVILASPLTAQTRHQLGATEIAAMKPGAWIVNVARGALIDDAALLPALRDGLIGGAILDAFETEPLPAQSEYWTLPNVIVTPHVSWKTTRARRRAAQLFTANLERYLGGQPMLNIVDLAAGY